MNWGVLPYWTGASVSQGVRFIRHFPKLETMTITVDCDVYFFKNLNPVVAHSLKRRELRRIAGIIRREIEEERRRDPAWRAPDIRAVCDM